MTFSKQDRKPSYGTFSVLAGHGGSFSLSRGDQIDIVNDSGTQVADFWCILPGLNPEYLSMAHCREVLCKVYFTPGDILLSNHYTPLLELVRDTAGGRHDTLIAACSAGMYKRFGRGDGHRSCAANFGLEARRFGWPAELLPQPWNLFMRAAISGDGAIEYMRPPYLPGGRVSLKALCPVVTIVSACPDDCYPTNGGDGSPKDISVVVSCQQ